MIEHLLSGEINAERRKYIALRFPELKLLVPDISSLRLPRIVNSLAMGLPLVNVPDLDCFIIGTSCIEFSGENRDRKSKSKSQQGESGITLRALISYLKTYRPRNLIFENVDDVLNSCADESDVSLDKQIERIVDKFVLALDDLGYKYAHRVINPTQISIKV